jgi:hypothetical protein
VRTFHDRVGLSFNNKFKVAGTAGGRTFSKCLLFFSPRFLVETLSADPGYINSVNNTGKANAAYTQADYTTAVNAVQTTSGIHFRVDTQAAGATSWDPANQQHLRLTLDGTEAAVFPQRYAEMMGVAAANMATAASYQALARQVIPDAVVSSV